MKKIFVSMMALMFVLPVYANILVGTVDVQKVLVTIKEGKAVRDKLKGEFDKKQKLLKKDEAAIQKAQQNYQKQSMVMNDKAKANKEREIQGMIMQLQQKTMKFQKEIQGMEQKLKKPILDRIKGLIEEASKKAKVDLTFEVSTAPVIYAKSQKDLTDEVIKMYDKKYPKK